MLAKSDGLKIRDGDTELASFGANGSVMGRINYPHIILNTTDLEFYGYGAKKLAHISSLPYTGLYFCKDINGQAEDLSHINEYSVRLLPFNNGAILGHVEIMAPVNDGDSILLAEAGTAHGDKRLIEIYFDETNEVANLDITGNIWAEGNIEADGQVNCNGNMSTAADFTADGNIYASGHSTPIGDISYDTGEKANTGTTNGIASSTSWQVPRVPASLTLPAGTWILIGFASFASNTAGKRRGVRLYKTTSTAGVVLDSNVVVGGNTDGLTNIQTTAIVTPTANTTYRVEVIQYSGSRLDTTIRLQAIRIV